MVSTANPILLIPPHHHHQQQSHLQINLRKKRKMMNANQSSDTSSESISIGEQYITDEWIVDEMDCPMPTSKPLLNAFRAIYFSKAISPSHIFLSLSTLTLILKMKSSKQRSLANPRQIMRMNLQGVEGVDKSELVEESQKEEYTLCVYDLWKKASTLSHRLYSCGEQDTNKFLGRKESKKTNYVESRLGKVKNTAKMNGFI